MWQCYMNSGRIFTHSIDNIYLLDSDRCRLEGMLEPSTHFHAKHESHIFSAFFWEIRLLAADLPSVVHVASSFWTPQRVFGKGIVCHETSRRPVIRRAGEMPRALAVSTDRHDSMENLRQRTYSAVDRRMEVCHRARRYPHAGVRWTSLHDFLQSGDDHGHVRGVAGVRTSLSERSLQRTMPLLEIIWSGSTQPSSPRVFLHLVEGSRAYTPNRGDLPHACVQSTGSKLWQRLCLVGVGYKTCWSVACARRTSRVSSLFFAWNRQRGASARLLQSFTHRASVIRRFVSYFSKIAQVSAKLTIQHSEHVCVFQTSGECCTLGSQGTSHNSSYLTGVPGQH